MVRSLITLIVILGLYLAIDFYAFKGLKLLMRDWNQNSAQIIVTYMYWGASIVLVAGILIGLLNRSTFNKPDNYAYFFFLFAFFLLMFLPKLIFVVFHLVDDVFFVIKWLVKKLSANIQDIPTDHLPMSRDRFITTLGLMAAAIPFGAIIYGVVRGRFNFKVYKQQLSFPNLPETFNGFRIVQISDIHIGSFFNNHKPVAEAIEMVNKLHPDMIVFTGDLVNNYAREMEGWVNVLGKLHAPHGVYSILGNHDYGDYVPWESKEARNANLNRLKDYHAECGFELLLNQHRIIRKGKHEIALVGVENWGKPPFPQYGDLNKAMQHMGDAPFKVLLSHDPSHWDLQVIQKTDIDLTLSGHTHGMQFGIETGRIKWSPVKYRYPRWGGLYQEANQYLYVNRGLGYIGFPGRVGINPEITLIELFKA